MLTTTTTPAAKPAPDPALLAEVGVDGAYMTALAEQEEKRRKVREARAVKAKAAAGSAATMRLAAAFAVRESDPEMAAYVRARTRTEPGNGRSSANWSRRRAKPPRRRPPSPSTTREKQSGESDGASTTFSV